MRRPLSALRILAGICVFAMILGGRISGSALGQLNPADFLPEFRFVLPFLILASLCGLAYLFAPNEPHR